MSKVIYAGWLIKSPPGEKLQKTFKIFRAHWKKRYFVLQNSPNDLPNQYELIYYKDEKCNHKKGSIDLEQCEQIIEGLDSKVFKHLIAITTHNKKKLRTYYLSADTEKEMDTWAAYLIQACGLKLEEQPTGNLEFQPAHPFGTNALAEGSHSQQSMAMSPSPQLPPRMLPTAPSLSLTADRNERLSRENNLKGMSHLPEISQNSSNVSVPPLSQKKHPRDHKNGKIAVNTNVVESGVYDYPPQARPVERLDDKQEPTQYLQMQAKRTYVDKYGKDSSTDHSSCSSPGTPDSCASSGHTANVSARLEDYDYPRSSGSGTSSEDENLSQLPSKPHNLKHSFQNAALSRTNYLNVNVDLMNIVPAAPSLVSGELTKVLGYDIPRSSSRSKSQAHAELSGSHSYLNTGDMPRTAIHTAQSSSSDNHTAHQKDTETDTVPEIPPPRAKLTSGQVPEEGSSVIFSTKRTRSFKRTRNDITEPLKQGPKGSRLNTPAQVPISRPPQQKPTADFTENEETHQLLNLLQTVPAPTATAGGHLKYIDLVMPESGHEPHGHSPTEHGRESMTMYREIDFVKTQALSDTKRVKDSQRIHDDRAL